MNVEELLENNAIKELYEKKTKKRSIWKGEPTKAFKSFITSNKVKLEKIISKRTNIDQKVIAKKENPKIRIAKHFSTSSIKPTIFNASFDETWKLLIEEGKERRDEGKIKRIKGVIIILPGETGSGKTHFGIDFCNMKGYDLGYRIIPSGSPLYVLMTDVSPLDEIERNYADRLWNDVFPFNCYVKNESTGYIDPLMTLSKFNEYLSSLKEQTSGTIVIEDWTIYCALVLYSYMLRSGGKDSKGISFNEFMRPEKPIAPTEHMYKARIIDQVLLSFQNDFKLNFILIANLKDETINTGDSVYKYKKTGDRIPDMQKGSERKADIVAKMYKEKEGGFIVRKVMVIKSRFEPKIVDANKIVMTSPTSQEFMDNVVDLYLKRKKDYEVI